jgi:hypothetical protein
MPPEPIRAAVPTGMPTTAGESEEVLRFWFPEHLRPEHAAMVEQFGWWFGGGANDLVAERFSRCWSARRTGTSTTGRACRARGWR